MARLDITKPTGTAGIFGTSTTDDYLIGTSGDDIITGGAATIAYTADGLDIMQGGAGDDRYIVNNTTGSDVIIEYVNEGIDTVFSSVNYTLSAEVENLVATGATGVTLIGNTKDNVMDGSQSSSADTLYGVEGSDTYIMGAGDIIVEGRKATATATQYTDTGGIDTISSATTVDLSHLITDAGQLIGGADTIKGQAYIENVTLTGATAANITGNAKNNTLVGNSAANTIDGGAGNDTLDGNGGGDTLIGGLGNDTFIKRNVADVFTEASNAGTDTIISDLAVDLTSIANVENITLTGTGAVNATGNSLINIIKGNSGVNTLTGGAGTDTLSGLQGNDTLDGGTGMDTMYGGRGNDTYIVDSTSDVVNEVGALADGTADLVKSSVTYTLNTTAAAAVENMDLTGTGAVNATGNALANILNGNSGANVLNGMGGADTMAGGAGNDTYVVDNISDSVTEASATGGTDLIQSTAASFTIPTNVENLTLTGTAAINGTGNTTNNVIIGNTGNNTINGDDGNDTISGGAGGDTLGGGLGDDTITGGVGRDVVTTGAGNDKIVFAAGTVDTFATATSVAGIDLYSDLLLDAGNADRIDLTAVVASVNTGVTVSGAGGIVADATFISSMNTALNVSTSGVGFDTTVADISAAIVTFNNNTPASAVDDRMFLAVDLDKSNTFTASDFVIEITGSTATTIEVSSFF